MQTTTKRTTERYAIIFLPSFAFITVRSVSFKYYTAQPPTRIHTRDCFRAVLVSRFLSDNLRIMSASKDKTVRVWDIAAEVEVASYSEFKVRYEW